MASRSRCSSGVSAGVGRGDRIDAVAVDIDGVAADIAPAVPEGVVENREQPGLQVRAGLELPARPERLDVGVLHEVLGVGFVARQAQRGAVQAVEMAQRVGFEGGRHGNADLRCSIGLPRRSLQRSAKAYSSEEVTACGQIRPKYVNAGRQVSRSPVISRGAPWYASCSLAVVAIAV